ALRQAFLYAMLLTLYANIKPEFQINFQSSNLHKIAIDLVKTRANSYWQDATK
ncbi:6798_t:CDS:2, partial [Gigaspora margarita]